MPEIQSNSRKFFYTKLKLLDNYINIKIESRRMNALSVVRIDCFLVVTMEKW